MQPQQHPQAWMLPAERVTLLISLALGNFAPEGNHLRIAVQLFPPALVPPALHAFFALFCRHRCPPRVIPWGIRVCHAAHARRSTHDGLGFTCHNLCDTPLTPRRDSSALPA